VLSGLLIAVVGPGLPHLAGGVMRVKNGKRAEARTITASMPVSRAAVRALFCLASALVAVALADPLMEAASNAGLFGRGNFTDHSNLDVLPAFVLGITFAVAWAIARMRQLPDAQSRGSAFLRNSASALDTATIVKMLPTAVAIQICALFAMETLEQIAVFGHPLGGSIWLGGPIFISLGLHAFFGVAVAAFFGKTLHAFAETLARIALRIRRLIVSLNLEGALKAVPLRRLPLAHSFSPMVCRIGERAPPFSLRTS